MLHLNAKLKKLKILPVKQKNRPDRKFELKLAKEAPPNLLRDYGRSTVLFPWS